MKKTLIGLGVLVLVVLGILFYKNLEVVDDLASGESGGSVAYQKILNGYKTNEVAVNAVGSSVSSNTAGGGGGGALKSSLNSYANNSYMAEVSVDRTVGDSQNIAFTVGADQDIQLFRENIAEGHIPNPDVITYNGVYSDYHFDLPDGKCDTLFCPLVSAGEVKLEEEDSEYRVQFGLGSSMKDKDFQRPPTNFVVVIDKSGSMSAGLGDYYYEGKKDYFIDDRDNCARGDTYFYPGQRCVSPMEKKKIQDDMDDLANKDKLTLAMEALSNMVDKLQGDDRIAVVVFDNDARVVHPLIKSSQIDPKIFKKHVKEIRPSGGTNMESGIKEALDILEDQDGEEYQNRIIFLTDAMPNIGNSGPHGLEPYIEDAADDDIYFSFLGVGVDFQQQFVQQMADIEGSNYFFISQYYDLQRRLVDEFDYNFFPMIFDLEAQISDEDVIDEAYGLDTDLDDGELLTINTLFPTPPTDEGYRGSIILLKLKDIPDEDLEFDVNYRTYQGKEESVSVTLDVRDFDDPSDSMSKGVELTYYVDSLKGAIDDMDEDELEDILEILEQSEDLYDGDDHDMREKEIETIEGLQNLLENGEKVKKDYWLK